MPSISSLKTGRTSLPSRLCGALLLLLPLFSTAAHAQWVSGTTSDKLFIYSSTNAKVTIVRYIGTAAKGVIPSTINGLPVTSIGGDAFYNCTTLTSVTIPSGITGIGDYAFYGCLGLTSGSIPNTVATIGEDAFAGCSSLDKITISSSVTRIEDYTFYGCISLSSVTMPDGITSIGDYAFAKCGTLSSITIPNNVTSIGNYAFNLCTNLSAITIPDNVSSIGNYAFAGCTRLTTALFMGDAPSLWVGVFATGTSNPFAMLYYHDATGFTTPTWSNVWGDKYQTIDLGTPATTGTYYLDFSGVVPVLDLSGSYSGTLMYSGTIGQGIDLDFSLNADPSGKLTGRGTLNSDDGAGNEMNGNITVNGTVKTSGSATLVSMTISGTGTGTIAVGGSSHDITFSDTIKPNCQITGTSRDLFVTGGTSTLKKKDLVTGKTTTQTGKLAPGPTFPLPDDVTGDWNMTLYLNLNKTLYTGTAGVQTSTSGTANLTATGSYSKKPNTSTLALKRTGCSVSMVVSTSGTTMLVKTMSGKLYGQTLKYKAP